MKSVVRQVDDHGNHYTALMFCCPGCAENVGGDGIHMLSVNSPNKPPSWEWNGNLEHPTLSPSILTHNRPYDSKGVPQGICHSFLKDGVFEYLSDCTHSMAGQEVPMTELPTWAEKE